ncbi:Vps51/Vps67 family protein [Theileria parva strain Muguga]|uniref:Vacuolar protein sorting-associated protein 51 homolog n=1 Tax=Theileria parva TaxID=5875 RepID=Q4MZL9_THEPA|nr:Vps51/Vps67 family protein [Theileria parva strain Muguga]EAN31242.1 Vps51/Vps67 family protein [Theileria parva strain Muguga]|eukprot:XP_763525.1 hypothetical protein [Theileria parva strain Muguga]
MDLASSFTHNDSSLSLETSDKSVSELLSAYYNISEDLPESSSLENDKSEYKLKRSASILNKEFLSHSFDVEHHFDQILRNNSISDTIGLLRKLEREIRQLTAGKQLLIYDNYECLFSALDTVHNINKELDQVQNNLKTLNSSQVKAASKDITSRYGIRDNFLHISNLSKAGNVFMFLSNLCNTLVSFNTSKGLFYSSSEETSNFVKYSPKDVLYFCSTVYQVFKQFDQNYNFLFSSYYPILTNLISSNVTLMLSNQESLYSDALVDTCKFLHKLSFNQHQLYEFYFFKLSSFLENKIRNLFINYSNSDFSYNSLCNDVFESLFLVYDSVSNENFKAFLNSLDLTGERGNLCFYCFDNLEVQYEYNSKSKLFSSFKLSSNSCSCCTEDLLVQFLMHYTHTSFFPLTYSITSYKYNLKTRDVTSGLTVLFERLTQLKISDNYQLLFLEHCTTWLMVLSLLYVQHLFFKLYESIISKLVSFLNGSYTSDFNYVLTSFEKLVEELRDVSHFAKDLSVFLKNGFEQVFNSLVFVYFCGIKYICYLVFVNIVKLRFKSGETQLYSTSNLMTLRSCDEKNKNSLIDHFLTESGRNLDLNVDNDFNLFSVIEFMDRNVKLHFKNFKFDSNNKLYMKNLLLFLLKFEELFQSLLTVLERNFNESHKMLTTNSLVLSINPKTNSEFNHVKCKFREHFIKNTNNLFFNTIFDDLFIDEHLPLLNVLLLSHKYANESKAYFPLKNYTSGFSETFEGKFTNSDYKLRDDCFSKNHFERFNISITEMTNNVISHIMFDYIYQALKILRFVLENLMLGNDVVDESIKDFTILLSEVLQDVNVLTISHTPETANLNKDLDKVINTFLNNSDFSILSNVYKFKFNASRDMCLKLFTLHIVQALYQYKTEYLIDKNNLIKFYEDLKRQILIIFKKNLDLFIMQSVWEKVLNLT